MIIILKELTSALDPLLDQNDNRILADLNPQAVTHRSSHLHQRWTTMNNLAC